MYNRLHTLAGKNKLHMVVVNVEVIIVGITKSG